MFGYEFCRGIWIHHFAVLRFNRNGRSMCHGRRKRWSLRDSEEDGKVTNKGIFDFFLFIHYIHLYQTENRIYLIFVIHLILCVPNMKIKLSIMSSTVFLSISSKIYPIISVNQTCPYSI